MNHFKRSKIIVVTRNSAMRRNNGRFFASQTPVERFVANARTSLERIYADDEEKLKGLLADKYTIGKPVANSQIIMCELTQLVSHTDSGNVYPVAIGTGAISPEGRGASTMWTRVIVAPHQNQAPNRSPNQPETPAERQARYDRNEQFRRQIVEDETFNQTKAVFVLSAIPVLHLSDEGTFETVIYLPSYYNVIEGVGMLDLSWKEFLPDTGTAAEGESEEPAPQRSRGQKEEADEMASALTG
jgi:hypothetical protein